MGLLEQALRGRRIILGITGGIAAYKSVDLASQLTKLGASVHAVLTDNAANFVAPLSLEVMTNNKVHQKQYEGSLGHIDHIQLADSADLVLIAPATANTIAKLATGVSDNLLLDLCLVTRAPIMIAPAMNTKMWQHPTVVKNVEYLSSIGYEFIAPDFGLLACKHVGEGRLAEQDRIVAAVTAKLSGGGKLAGKRVMISLGGTREAIDPVRFIANHSSGLMGKALARAVLAEGAELTLITTVPLEDDLLAAARVIEVESAAEMHAACVSEWASSDVAIMAAAVADYKPRAASVVKLKKQSSSLALELEATVDIAAELGATKRAGQILVGFALETDDLVKNALLKLSAKNLDLVVANSAETLGAETASVTIIDKDSRITNVTDNKAVVAARIVDCVVCHSLATK